VLRKMLLQSLFGHRIRQVADIQFGSHQTLLFDSRVRICADRVAKGQGLNRSGGPRHGLFGKPLEPAKAYRNCGAVVK
jgi:hypothetical protein